MAVKLRCFGGLFLGLGKRQVGLLIAFMCGRFWGGGRGGLRIEDFVGLTGVGTFYSLLTWFTLV